MKLLRRLTLVSACAASLWDIQTTSAGVSKGLTEGNGFLAGSQGKPRWGRMIAVKAGLCAGSAVAQEVKFSHNRLPDSAWIALNSAITGVFVRTALHNRAVTAEAARNQTAAPAYLMAQK